MNKYKGREIQWILIKARLCQAFGMVFQEAVAFNQILKATALFEVTMYLHLDTNCIGAWTKYVSFLYLGHWWLDRWRNRFYWLCRPWEQWDFWLSDIGSHFAWTTQRSLYHHTSWWKYHVYRYFQWSSKWPFGTLQRWPWTPVLSFWFQVA